MRRILFLKLMFVWICIICSNEIALTQTRILLTQPKLENRTVKFGIRIEHDFNLADINSYDLKIRENGVEVPLDEYYLDCPFRCGNVSVPINMLIDQGISMDTGFPSGIDEAKIISKTFFDISKKYQTGNDLINVMCFNDKITLTKQSSTDYLILQNTIDSIQTGGHSAIWDAAYQAHTSYATHGELMILITTGNDQSTQHNLQDLVDYSLAHDLRLYTIAVGTNIKDSVLQYVATKTHGKYYVHPDSTNLQQLYNDIWNYYVGYDYYCDLSYVTPCDPNSVRTIEVSAKGYTSQDSAQATTVYSSFSLIPRTINFQLIPATVRGGSPVRMTLRINPKSINHFFSLNISGTLKVDTNIMKLDGIALHKIFPIETATYLFKGHDGYQFSIVYDKDIYISDTIAYFYFTTLPRKTDTTLTVSIDNWSFVDKCLNANNISSQIRILKSLTAIENVTNANKSFYLSQNYPNPFTRMTNVDLPLLLGEGRVEDSQRRGEVVFKVYDVFGREVLDLSKDVISNFATANLRSSLVISNSQLPSQGIYFYRLTVGNESQTKIMTLIK